MDILSVKGLCKRYESFSLKNVGFTVRKGEIMGFIGRNGAGKTTTLKSLLNHVHPDAGEILFFGRSFNDSEREIKSRIGFVSGGVDYYMRKKLKLITDVTRRFYPEWDEAAYRKYMARFSLDERKTPQELSAGMKVKYNLALALSHRAELLILDEPTSGLDPVSRDDLLDVFMELCREGASILFSTHITSDLDKCADRITYIHNGEVLACGELEAFKRKYSAVTLADDELTEALKPALIGLKPAKHGYSAIIESADPRGAGLNLEPADLDTIMVHIEKERSL